MIPDNNCDVQFDPRYFLAIVALFTAFNLLVVSPVEAREKTMPASKVPTSFPTLKTEPPASLPKTNSKSEPSHISDPRITTPPSAPSTVKPTKPSMSSKPPERTEFEDRSSSPPPQAAPPRPPTVGKTPSKVPTIPAKQQATTDAIPGNHPVGEMGPLPGSAAFQRRIKGMFQKPSTALIFGETASGTATTPAHGEMQTDKVLPPTAGAHQTTDIGADDKLSDSKLDRINEIAGGMKPVDVNGMLGESSPDASGGSDQSPLGSTDFGGELDRQNESALADERPGLSSDDNRFSERLGQAQPTPDSGALPEGSGQHSIEDALAGVSMADGNAMSDASGDFVEISPNGDIYQKSTDPKTGIVVTSFTSRDKDKALHVVVLKTYPSGMFDTYESITHKDGRKEIKQKKGQWPTADLVEVSETIPDLAPIPEGKKGKNETRTPDDTGVQTGVGHHAAYGNNDSMFTPKDVAGRPEEGTGALPVDHKMPGKRDMKQALKDSLGPVVATQQDTEPTGGAPTQDPMGQGPRVQPIGVGDPVDTSNMPTKWRLDKDNKEDPHTGGDTHAPGGVTQ